MFLHHWGRVKMADISDTISSKAFLKANTRVVILLKLRDLFDKRASFKWFSIVGIVMNFRTMCMACMLLI